MVESPREKRLRHPQVSRLRQLLRLFSLDKSLSKVNDTNVLLVFVKPFPPTCGLYDLLREARIERLAIKASQLFALGLTEDLENLLRAGI